MSDDDRSLEDRFDGYPLTLAAVSQLRAYNDVLRQVEPANDEEAAKVERWKARLERAFRALESVDPVLLEGPLVTKLGNEADAAAVPLETGVSQPQTEPTAESLFGSILQLVSLPAGGPEARPLSHIADPAASLVDELTDEVTSLRESVGLLQQKRDDLTEQFETKLAGADDEVTAQVQRLDERVQAAVKRASDTVEADRKAFAKAAESHDQDAERLLGELRRKLGIAADESLSAGYGNAAKDEEKAANWLRLGAILAGVVAVAFAVVAVLLVGEGGEWGRAANIPIKIAAIAAPAAVARYLSVQSNSHRHEARRLRQVQLELSNLGEYVSELSEAERAEVRKVLVARYFAMGEPEAKGQPFTPVSQMVMAQLGLDGRRSRDDTPPEAGRTTNDP